jgi:signal transduction histidine kinase
VSGSSSASSASKTPALSGSGLGLWIARLVELKGGRLRLGEAEGGGALFEIALPRSAA